METRVVYFEQRGTSNTQRVLELAALRASELGVGDIVVATTGGTVGMMAPDALPGFNVVVVTHSTGFAETGRQEVPTEVIDEIRRKGAHVLTTTHAFGGVGRAVRNRLKTYQTEEIIAQTLRLMGQGTKVAVEVTLMAADAGLISPHNEVIACGGTGHGLDTALVLKPAHAQSLFDLEIREVICKPRVP
jgi:hypothetical protein